MNLEEFRSHFQKVRGKSAQCPSHQDRKNSLSIDEAGGHILVKCHAGCETEAVLSAAGLKLSDLFVDNGNGGKPHDPIVHRYVYSDENGKPLYRVCRTAVKNFFQERFEGGAYIPGLNGVRRVLYNLSEVLKAKTVFVVEGEKDVETLRALGLIATTNAGGADAWSDSYAESLKDKWVPIIPDNDEPGHKHAWKVARSALPFAKEVRFILLPDVPEKGDVTDYLKNHTKEDLLNLVRAAKAVRPEDVAEKRDSGVNSQNSLNSQPQQVKPVLKAESLHGLAGRIVRTIEPYSEADQVAILSNVLTAFGNVVGPIPYFRVEFTHHYLNLFVIQVGDTSKGRKGVAWSTPRRMFSDIDGVWQTAGGLSSGEGLIYAVRDERREKKPIREKGRVVDYEYVLVDEGATDKRLLLIEEEFSQALKVMSREGNILSPVIRQAWDGLTLNPLTKNSPLKATGSHISIIGHITRTELLRHLNDTEQSNGFGNRFCWFLVSRSKCIATPDGVPDEKLLELVEELRQSVDFARKVGEMRRDENAEREWQAVYPELSEGKPGLVGSMISRAEAQVMRIACLYALLDKSAVVGVKHIEAGLALWECSEESVKAIFGEQAGDPNVDTARAALKAKGELSLTELHAMFGRHVSAAEIQRVIEALIRGGAILEEVRNENGGRPSTIVRWAAN